MILPAVHLYPSVTLGPGGLMPTRVTTTIGNVPAVYVLVVDSVP